MVYNILNIYFIYNCFNYLLSICSFIFQQVYITVNGTCGKINKTRLFKKKAQKSKHSKASFKFSKDSTQTFKIHSPDIGDIKSLLIEVCILLFIFCILLQIKSYKCIFHN